MGKERLSAADMRARDMQPKDLARAFGSKGVVSEVLSGKRGISQAAARKLAVPFSGTHSRNSIFCVSGKVKINPAPMTKNAEFKARALPMPYRSAKNPTTHGAVELNPLPML